MFKNEKRVDLENIDYNDNKKTSEKNTWISEKKKMSNVITANW